MPDVLIRSAEGRDLDSLARMGASLARMHHTFDAKRFMLPAGVEEGYRWWLGEEMQNPDAVLLAAELDGAVVGYAYGRLEERDWNLLLDKCGALHDIWVDDAARRRGISVKLAEEMFRRLEAKGAPRIVLHTAATNTAAQKLFERLGFRHTMIEMTRETGGKKA